jgi:tyrosine-protein kinase Etk/Wzc
LQLLPDTPLIRVAATGAETPDPVRVEQLFSQLPQILDEAKTAGAFVIVDTAPLGEVSDALRVAGHVDDIVILVRPGHTRRAQFAVMRDLLDRAGYAPTGLVVIGSSAKLPSSSYYYGVSGRGADERASRTRRIGIAGR